ncbi:TPA: hypothetical protein EYP38_00765, partial [Candidatus Micrarchaeota archaeon]|nr:hypothetical protein [Candidatus Micrarchaeota archaeon]
MTGRLTGITGRGAREESALVIPIIAGRLSGLVPTREEMSQELSRELETARAAVAGLREYAGRLQRVVPVPDMMAELARMRQRMDEIGISRITIMGEQRFADEAEAILQIAREAARLSESTNERDQARAVTLYRRARAQLRGLVVVIDNELAIVSLGRPPGMSEENFTRMLDSFEGIVGDFGTDTRMRAYVTLEAVRHYLRYNHEYSAENPRVRLQRDALFGMITDLGDDAMAGREYTEEHMQRDRARMTHFGAQAR